MRVDPPLTMPGRFWLPATPDRTQPGTLHIEDGGKVHLELIGRLDGGHLFNAPRQHDRVVGEVIEHGYVTLEECYLTEAGHYGSGAPHKHELEPRRALIGIAYDENEAMLFDELKFSIEGLDEWLAITGLKTGWRPDPEEKMTIEFTPPEKRELWKDEDFSLRCEFEWSAPTTALKSAEVNQTAFLRLRSAKAVPLEAFVTKVHQLAHLVALAVDANVSVQTVSAYADAYRLGAGTKYERPMPLRVYFEALSFADKPPKIREIDRLFTLAGLPVSSQSAINAWFRLHSVNNVATNLYFSTRKQRFEYLNIKFVLMSQAAEVYHRNSSEEKLMPNADFKKLKQQILELVPEAHRKMVGEKLAHGNDFTLANRLERLMAPFECFFGNAATREETIRSIVGTRNHYTHWGKSGDRDEYGGINLWTNLMRLDMLMQMHLLKELGYSVADVTSILEKNLIFQRQCHLLKPPVAVPPPIVSPPLLAGSSPPQA
jgi:hypothetical protein